MLKNKKMRIIFIGVIIATILFLLTIYWLKIQILIIEERIDIEFTNIVLTAALKIALVLLDFAVNFYLIWFVNQETIASSLCNTVKLP